MAKVRLASELAKIRRHSTACGFVVAAVVAGRSCVGPYLALPITAIHAAPILGVHARVGRAALHGAVGVRWEDSRKAKLEVSVHVGAQRRPAMEGEKDRCS